MKILVTVPDVPYYLWQVLVQINNFRKMGYEENTHYLISTRDNNLSSILKSFIDSKDLKCHFHLFHDTRIKTHYTASLKPFLVKQFLKRFPEAQKETFFYTDPDVIFLKKINFSKYMNDDIWYFSDAASYLNSTYIKSKGEQLFIEMCDIVGIDPKLVEENDVNCGGAQWIIKNNTPEMWQEIEDVCVELYNHMVGTAAKYQPEGQEYPIQAWTAEMWATIWVAWKHGIKSKVPKELDFCMSSDTIERANEVSILHNAGVPLPNETNFCKCIYQVSPFNEEIKGKKESASWKYIMEIKETEKNFKELLF